MVWHASGLYPPWAEPPRPADEPSSCANTIFTAHIVKRFFIAIAAFRSGLRPPKESDGT